MSDDPSLTYREARQRRRIEPRIRRVDLTRVIGENGLRMMRAYQERIWPRQLTEVCVVFHSPMEGHMAYAPSRGVPPAAVETGFGTRTGYVAQEQNASERPPPITG